MQVSALARALGVDVVSTNFIRLNVERLTDIAEELQRIQAVSFNTIARKSVHVSHMVCTKISSQ